MSYNVQINYPVQNVNNAKFEKTCNNWTYDQETAQVDDTETASSAKEIKDS